jgi:hypothetical protein
MINLAKYLASDVRVLSQRLLGVEYPTSEFVFSVTLDYWGSPKLRG